MRIPGITGNSRELRIIFLSLFLSGCVTPARHRLELKEVRREEINFALKLASQVDKEELSASDMIFILRGHQE